MKRAVVLMAATLVVAGFDVVPVLAAANGNVVTPTTGHASTQPTVGMAALFHATPGDPTHAKIEDVIAHLTQDAMTPNGLAQLATLFSDAQRQSLVKSSTYSQGYGDKLDAQIGSISKTWKQKYGHDFAIAKSPGDLNEVVASIKAQTAGQGNARMESAIVNIRSAKGPSELQVPLVYEKSGDWKIQAPNSLTAQSLRANLMAALTRVENQSASWPANEADAYRLIARHVVMAVLDKPMPAQTSATTQPLAKLAQLTSPATAPAAPQAKQVSTTPSHSWWRFWTW